MKKIVLLFLVLIMLLALFAGCGENKPVDTAAPTMAAAPADSGATGKPSDTAAPVDTAPVDEGPYKFAAGKYATDADGWTIEKYEYPLPLSTTDESFSLLTINYTPQYVPEEGYLGIETWATLQENTGVNIEYIIVSRAGRAEQFAALLAADDLPDIMSQGQNQYPGPLGEALEDGYFLNIYPYREYMPNYFYEVLARSPESPKLYESTFYDSETVAIIWEIMERDFGEGWFIRQDWLDALGLGSASEINTFDELYEALTAFKAAYGSPECWPMLVFSNIELSNGDLLCGYNTKVFTYSIGYYKRIVDGKVEYCGATEDDRAAYTMLNKWFTEGLIDPDYATYTDSTISGAAVTAGRAGCVYGSPADVKSWEGNNVDPNSHFEPLPLLLLEDPQTLHYNQAPNFMMANYTISNKCANIPLVLTWCDYAFSPSGSDFISWGPEGLTWEYNEKGERRLTDLIMDHPAGIAFALNIYGVNIFSDAGLVSVERQFAFDGGDRFMKMFDAWDPVSFDGAYDFPAGCRLTPEQNEDISSRSGDLSTYFSESATSFITGDIPLSNWDSFMNTLNDMGLQKSYATWQEAYEDYLARKAA